MCWKNWIYWARWTETTRFPRVDGHIGCKNTQKTLTITTLGPRFKTYWVDEDEEKNLRVAITKRNDVKMKLALEEINIRGNSGDFQIKNHWKFSGY